MRKLLLFFCLITIIMGCDKSDHDDLSGSEVIRGRLYAEDAMNPGTLPKILAKKKVTLRYQSELDTVNYLFSTLTDEEGYFTFTNLKKSTTYVASYMETTDGIVYAASDTVTAPRSGIFLISKIAGNQSGLVLTVKDYTGNPIKENNICLFRSPDNLGYINNNCEGSSYTIKTDANGKARLFGIPNGKYYALSSLNVQQVPLVGKKSFTINGNVLIDSLELGHPNGIVVTLKSDNNTVKETSVCLFTSPDDIGYANNVCEGNSFTAKTDATGKARFFGIPKGIYYMLSSTQINGIPLLGKQPVEVSEKDILNVDLQLAKPNGIRFITTDAESNPISNVSICVFNSKILSEIGLCNGSNYQLTSLADGQITQYNLPKTNYYIIATKTIDDKIWIARGTAKVENSIITVELKLIPK